MLLHQTILNNPSQRSLCLFFFFFIFRAETISAVIWLASVHLKCLIFLQGTSGISRKKKNTGLSQKCCVTRIKDWALQYCQTSTHMQGTLKKVRKWTNENVLILLSYMRRVTFSAPPPGFLSKKVFAQLLSVLFVTCLVSSTWASQVDTDSTPQRWHNGHLQFRKKRPITSLQPSLNTRFKAF